MNGLLNRFNNEVQNKVELKMVPNKTEEQVLNSFFKFYDLQGTGTCNLTNFIKSMERLGVILPRISDIESIFNYYSNNSGVLNYKDFSRLIYDKNNKYNINYNNNNDNLKIFDFSEILYNSLIEDGNGLKNLIKLLKSFSIIDYNNMKRLSLDEFLKIIKENKININSNQIQFLFQNFEYFANGVVYYKNILKEVMNKNWNVNKENVFKNFLNNLYNNNNNNNINLKTIKNYLNYNNNNNYLENYINQYINLFGLDENKPLNDKEIRHLIGFLSFGVDDKELNEILNGENTYSEINKNYNNKNKNNNNNNYYLTSQSNYLSSPDSYNNYNDIADINYTVNKIKSNLNKYSRKTLFNFLKHFKYYENNNNNNILSFDFEKVLQDFRINLLPNELKSIFNYFAIDNKKSVINFNNFLKYLYSLNNNSKRENFIENAFKVLENKCKDLIKIFNMEFLKENYNSKNNIFNPDEALNKIDFYDCLDLFHNVFKGFKTDKITKNEFFEFYYFIGVLIDNDDDFGRMIYNEWNVEEENKKYLNYLPNNNNLNNDNNNFRNNNNNRIVRRNNNNPEYEKNPPKPFPQPQKAYNNNNNDYDNNNNYSNYNYNNFQRPNKLNNNNNFNPLENLKSKLQQRGVRGLLYLHRQFLLSTDISKVTFSDFCDVINKEQKLNLSNTELQSIFLKFKNNNNYLDFYSFIRNFKKELNEYKLNIVESVYMKLDKNQNENVSLNEVLNNYNSNNHPDVLNGKKNAEEKNIEFIDCFELQYELINNNNSNNNENIVTFEDFANFYEYVAFVYEDDKEFENLLLSTWS